MKRIALLLSSIHLILFIVSTSCANASLTTLTSHLPGEQNQNSDPQESSCQQGTRSESCADNNDIDTAPAILPSEEDDKNSGQDYNSVAAQNSEIGLDDADAASHVHTNVGRHSETNIANTDVVHSHVDVPPELLSDPSRIEGTESSTVTATITVKSDGSDVDVNAEDDGPTDDDEAADINNNPEQRQDQTMNTNTNMNANPAEYEHSPGATAIATETEMGDPLVSSSTSKEENIQQQQQVLVNYAHKNSGAIILHSSPGLDGASNILVSDRDKYAITPCEDSTGPTKWVIIALPEDILVKTISIANYERYSGHVKTFAIYGSTQIPTATNLAQEDVNTQNTEWNDLGRYNCTSTRTEPVFDVALVKPSWVRYLKLVFLDYAGVEFYCTLSQVKVHGSTMLQGFHEEYWKEKEEEDASIIVLEEDEEYDEEETDGGVVNSTDDSTSNENENGSSNDGHGMNENVETVDVTSINNLAGSDITTVDPAVAVDERSSSSGGAEELQSNDNNVGQQKKQEGDNNNAEASLPPSSGVDADSGSVDQQASVVDVDDNVAKTAPNNGITEDNAATRTPAEESKKTQNANANTNTNTLVTLSSEEQEQASHNNNADAKTTVNDASSAPSAIDITNTTPATTTHYVDPDTASAVASDDGGVAAESPSINEELRDPSTTILQGSSSSGGGSSHHQKQQPISTSAATDSSSPSSGSTTSTTHSTTESSSKPNTIQANNKAESAIINGDKDHSQKKQQHVDVEGNEKDNTASPATQTPASTTATVETKSATTSTAAAEDAVKSNHSQAQMQAEPAASTVATAHSTEAQKQQQQQTAKIAKKYTSCLDNLNYANFKDAKLSKVAKQKQQKAGHVAASQGMEPIFKTLSNDIKSMTVNQTIVDQYLVQMNHCYQSIIVAMEQDMVRRESVTMQRLDDLEDRLNNQPVQIISVGREETLMLSVAVFLSGLCVTFVLMRRIRRYREMNDNEYMNGYDESTSLSGHTGSNERDEFWCSNDPGEPDRSAGGKACYQHEQHVSAPNVLVADVLVL